MLVGAGCGAAKTATTGDDATAPAAATASGPAAINAAFTQAGLTFTTKDKTAVATTALGADGALLTSFTEYKFDGSGLIILAAEIKDPSNVPMLGDALGTLVKAQATATSLNYSSVGGLNDAHWAVFVLSTDADYATKVKALSSISK